VSDPEILVVCLCAQWCGVCREYTRVFAQVQERLPGMRFVWVDVEDQADLVDPIEVEDFPTLLIASGAEPRFFGPLTPQPGTLERIVRERSTHADPALAARADMRALVARLRAGD
jgi:thiol-disulfide isomerase/thioredoxin